MTTDAPLSENPRVPQGRAGLSAGYILKCRDRMQREIDTVKGRRRVRYWGPWVGIRYGLSMHEAITDRDHRMKTGLSEWAVFYRGKLVSGDPEPLAADFLTVESFERAVDLWEQRHGFR